MANYGLTMTALFRPLTFEELLKGPAMATLYQLDLEAKIQDLMDKAAVLELLSNNPNDIDVYNNYKNFLDRLQSAADDLYNKGFQNIDKNQFRNLKNDYNTTILPILNAYNKRELDIKAYNDALARDPSRITNINPNNIGLSSYMGKDNQIPLVYGVSGDNIMDLAAKMMSNLSKARPLNGGITKVMDNMLFKIGNGYGYSEKDIEDLKKYPEIQAIIDNIMLRPEVQRLGKDNQAAVENRVVEGILAGRLYDWKNSYMNAPKATSGGSGNGSGSNTDTKKQEDFFSRSPLILGQINTGYKETILENLVPTNEGFTTQELTKLEEERNELQKRINENTSGRASYEHRQEQLAAKKAAPKEGLYVDPLTIEGNQYEKDLSDLQKLDKKISKLGSEILELSNKYSHLSIPDRQQVENNPSYSQISTGLTLEKIQSAEQIRSYTPDIDATDFNKVVNGFTSIINSMGRDAFKKDSNIGLVEVDLKTGKEGKHMDYDAWNKLKNNELKTITPSINNVSGLVLNINNKPYKLKGREDIDRFNRIIKLDDEFLKNYTDRSYIYDEDNNMKANVTPVSNQAFNLLQYYLMTGQDLTGQAIGLNAEDLLSRYGAEGYYNNYTGNTEYIIKSGNNEMRIIVDNYGDLIGVSTLDDEINNLGRLRLSSFASLANAEFNTLQQRIAYK